MDDSINPAGYIKWSATDNRINNSTFMLEYQDYGPGFNLTSRLAAYPVTKEMTASQYKEFDSPLKVFQYANGKFGNTAWIDFSA
jgi:hypothetical protein